MWEDAEEVEHLIPQGEGGEQGDPMMLLLHSLGQHSALEATQEELKEDEVVCAFLDDIYVVTPDPHRIGSIYTTLQQHLHSTARSGSTVERPKCGTGQGSGPEAAKHWSASHS